MSSHMDITKICECLNPAASLTQDDVYMVLIAGGTASGKTTVARFIAETLRGKRVAFISQDNFYAEVTDPAARAKIARHEYDFDHPRAIDHELLCDTLRRLKNREDVEVPVYDFTTSSRTAETIHVPAADVIIVEGIFALYWEKIRELANLSIFVQTDADTRLARRIRRDTAERGRRLESVLGQYLRFVKDSHDQFIEPCKRYADVILPNISTDGVQLNGLHIIVRHLHAELDIRSRPCSPVGTHSGSEPN